MLLPVVALPVLARTFRGAVLLSGAFNLEKFPALCVCTDGGFERVQELSSKQAVQQRTNSIA
jgi:hypothetical protein